MDKRDREALDAHITGQYIDRDGDEDKEPYWAIDDEVEVIASKMDGGQFRYHVRECEAPNREVVITYTGEGRMLFDGEYIETESFMAYVGLLEMVEESPGKVIHCKEA
jgi:hypothetical protein